jgi:hypothetical protein
VTEAIPAREKAPRAQSVWLTIYWTAAVINTWLMIQGIASVATLPLPSVVAVILACVSTVLGAIFATRILRHRVSTTIFVKATTTVRVIAIAWIVLEVAIVSTAVVSVLTNIDTSELDWSAGFAGAVGSISLLAVLGPGYSEYREAIAPPSA